jgi:DNA helicase IV
MTVFADENQRLNEISNSTIGQIAAALSFVGTERVFALRHNHRNTKQVAEFAAHFYAGLKTGIPDLPRREGRLPVVAFSRSMLHIAERIAQYLRAQPNHEVGVLCPGDKIRMQIFTDLKRLLAGDKGLEAQSYSSVDSALNNADSLRFDRPGTVTVLNTQSAKGLEFDAVFIVDPLLASSASGGGQQQFKMNLYVMCSRARVYLSLQFLHAKEAVLPLMPCPEKYRVEEAE